MKDQQVESRLSRLVSDYKATIPYVTREPWMPFFQHRGWFFMEETLEQRNGLNVYNENIGHYFIIQQSVLS